MSIPQNGLIFHHNMSLVDGTTLTAVFGPDAVIEGAPPLVEGYAGADARQFRLANQQRCYIPSTSLLPSSGFTLTAVMKKLAGQGIQDYVVMGKDGFGQGWGVFLLINDTGYYASIVSSSPLAQQSVPAISPSVLDQFHILTLRYSPGNWLDLSVDENIAASRKTGTFTGLRSSSFGFQISGHPSSNPNLYVDGDRGDILGWSRVFSDQEVEDLHDYLGAQLLINGQIDENLASESWKVRATAVSDGTLISSDTVSNGPFSLNIPVSKAQPLYVTVSADIGAQWEPNATVAVDQKAFPTDPVTSPYYYKANSAGQTGATEPIWPSTPGSTVQDGDITWECVERLIQPITHGPLIPS